MYSIVNHSALEHHTFIHVNDGTDGTIEWLRSVGLQFTHSTANIGQSAAINVLTPYLRSEYVYLLDDDMYVLPGWDIELLNFLESNNLGRKALLNSTMIEPFGNGKHSISPCDYGQNPIILRDKDLLSIYKRLSVGMQPLVSTWWPLLISRSFWIELGGANTMFELGVGIETDIAKRAWDLGSRNQVSVPKSLVYHFQSKTTKRIPNYIQLSKNRDSQFENVHGINREVWTETVLRRDSVWERQDDE